jgi:hypothetical protein
MRADREPGSARVLQEKVAALFGLVAAQSSLPDQRTSFLSRDYFRKADLKTKVTLFAPVRFVAPLLDLAVSTRDNPIAKSSMQIGILVLLAQ